MKRTIYAILACFLMGLGFTGLASATEPASASATDSDGNPTNNGWTQK